MSMCLLQYASCMKVLLSHECWFARMLKVAFVQVWQGSDGYCGRQHLDSAACMHQSSSRALTTHHPCARRSCEASLPSCANAFPHEHNVKVSFPGSNIKATRVSGPAWALVLGQDKLPDFPSISAPPALWCLPALGRASLHADMSLNLPAAKL